jgi:pimeloyl-ACP methyl ester carboxylesterase
MSQISVPHTSVHKTEADGVRVFYRAAGDSGAPVVLLLHGFPTSSFMFRELIPRLADHYRVVAPDLPASDLRKFRSNENTRTRSKDWRRP